MKTIVYQSFRTQNVPPWISRCMESARLWAQRQGFEYKFWDDSFFDFVPADLRPRASTHVCLLSDYARLVAAKTLLREGWDRVIWVDADLFVFAPDSFTIDVTSGYAFCREVWHDLTLWGQPFFKLTVNNSVSVFCRDETIIDFYLKEAAAILQSNRTLAAASIGTEWLYAQRKHTPFPLLTNVGIFGPEMMFRYLRNDAAFLQPYLRFQTSPIHAVNLCHSKMGEIYDFSGTTTPWTVNDSSLLSLIDQLCLDKGASLNRHFDASYLPPADEFNRPLSCFQHWARKLQAFSADKLSLRIGKSRAVQS